jgi:radical SAM protein with 4Fe4S-binding SPASM domain
LEYERLADMILDGKLALAFCSAGRNYFTFSPDESITSCHRLAGETAFQVGEGSSGIQADLEPWRRHVDNNPVCSRCWIRYLCGGGCKQENYLSTGSIHTPNRDLCEYQISLVRGVLRVIARQAHDYLRRDRSPLDNLFVSCGRPVMRSNRADLPIDVPLRHFKPILKNNPAEER